MQFPPAADRGQPISCPTVPELRGVRAQGTAPSAGRPGTGPPRVPCPAALLAARDGLVPLGRPRCWEQPPLCRRRRIRAPMAWPAGSSTPGPCAGLWLTWQPRAQEPWYAADKEPHLNNRPRFAGGLLSLWQYQQSAWAVLCPCCVMPAAAFLGRQRGFPSPPELPCACLP